MREFVTLLDGSRLRVGDKCLALIGVSWRVVSVAEIMQGTGVDRVFVIVKNGTKLGPFGRYRLLALKGAVRC